MLIFMLQVKTSSMAGAKGFGGGGRGFRWSYTILATFTHSENFAVCLDYLGHSHGAKWRSIKCNIHNGLTHANADTTGMGFREVL